ncbi:MAG: hypothetical protein JWM80_5306 [Cyanobacteria bacterium RYN_339]|nr:hypothetical protein [Cyanobacteria bacterium RYN_339]
MITAREVLAYEKLDFDSMPLEKVREIAIETSTHLHEIGLRKVELHNRLIGPVSDAYDRLVKFGPPGVACIKDLLAHENPGVVRQALSSFHRVEPTEAEAIAGAIVKNSATSSAVREVVREATSWWRFHAKHPTHPLDPALGSEAAAGVAAEPAHAVDTYTHLDIGEVIKLARENGYDASIPWLPKLSWPSIRLIRRRVAMEVLAPGQSRLGGIPDMPPDMEWPRFEENPMSLIAQIDLAEIAAFRSFTHLPSAGHLLFFYDTFLASWGDDPGSWRVVYIAPGATIERRVPPEDLFANLIYYPMALEFRQEATLKVWVAEDPTEELDDFPPGLEDELTELGDVIAEARESDIAPLHRMAGAADFIQGDFSDCLAATDAGDNEHTRLLLQVDSDYLETDHGSEGMFWGSGGHIYFLIGRGDLLRGCFDNVALSLQCT